MVLVFLKFMEAKIYQWKREKQLQLNYNPPEKLNYYPITTP